MEFSYHRRSGSESVMKFIFLEKETFSRVHTTATNKRVERKQVKSILKLFPQFRYSKEKFHIPHTPTLFHIKVMERNSYWFFVVTFWLLFFHVAAADLSLLSYYVSTRHSHLKPLHLLSNLDIKMDRLRKSVRCVVVVAGGMWQGQNNVQSTAHRSFTHFHSIKQNDCWWVNKNIIKLLHRLNVEPGVKSNEVRI